MNTVTKRSAAAEENVPETVSNYAAIGQVLFFEQEWQRSRARTAADPNQAAIHDSVANALAWARGLLVCSPEQLIQGPRLDGGHANAGREEVIRH